MSVTSIAVEKKRKLELSFERQQFIAPDCVCLHRAAPKRARTKPMKALRGFVNARPLKPKKARSAGPVQQKLAKNTASKPEPSPP
jgi:hypothetical protein|tara:strand:- start:24 stop:278 length:255 start_codon:yes stop_codon:yes gene_type:complete